MGREVRKRLPGVVIWIIALPSYFKAFFRRASCTHHIQYFAGSKEVLSSAFASMYLEAVLVIEDIVASDVRTLEFCLRSDLFICHWTALLLAADMNAFCLRYTNNHVSVTL